MLELPRSFETECLCVVVLCAMKTASIGFYVALELPSRMFSADQHFKLQALGFKVLFHMGGFSDGVASNSLMPDWLKLRAPSVQNLRKASQ